MAPAAPNEVNPAKVVMLPCVACVVAVFGAKPAIVATVSAWPVNAPTKEVDVIEVAPVTTPASTAIVPSKRILFPATGSNFICPAESKIISPSAAISK